MEYWIHACRLDDVSFVPTVLLRLILAVIAGMIIGFERGKHGRAAGLRTHILISLGSAISAMVGAYMVQSSATGDPSRVAAGVVSGIGFLCAGIILVKNSSKVMGLTTAAAMWATATVGIAFGAGFYLCAVLGTALLFFTLTVMTVLEVNQKKDRRFFIEISEVSGVNDTIDNIRAEFPVSHSFDILPAKSGMENHVGISVNIMAAGDDVSVIEAVKKIPLVVFIVEE